MSGLFFSQTAPAEVIVHILRQADSASDVVALGSVCQRMNSIWRVHGARILLPIQCRQNPGFDDALIAVGFTTGAHDLITSLFFIYFY